MLQLKNLVPTVFTVDRVQPVGAGAGFAALFVQKCRVGTFLRRSRLSLNIYIYIYSLYFYPLPGSEESKPAERTGFHLSSQSRCHEMISCQIFPSRLIELRSLNFLKISESC